MVLIHLEKEKIMCGSVKTIFVFVFFVSFEILF